MMDTYCVCAVVSNELIVVHQLHIRYTKLSYLQKILKSKAKFNLTQYKLSTCVAYDSRTGSCPHMS
jgi:hypothetical protein